MMLMMLCHRQMCRRDCARRPWLMCGCVSQSVQLTRRIQELFRRENLSQINRRHVHWTLVTT
jgi:hypothetical protein